MIFDGISCIKYQIAFDGAFDSLQIVGVLNGDNLLHSLTENERINSHWKTLGCPNLVFTLEILREDVEDGSQPNNISSPIHANLSFKKNGESKGSGRMRLQSLAFDKLLSQIRSNSNQMCLFLAGKGANYIESQSESFKCKIQFTVHQTLFELK